MSKLQGKKITLCVTGGIAAYKSADLVERLKRQGGEVRVAMTSSACRFITPLTMSTLSGQGVATDILALDEDYPIPHIQLAAADLVIVAPATANILAKAASGIADELVSAIVLAAACPVLFAPSMNVNMYNNPATQGNIALLQKRGYYFIGPDTGHLACNVEAKGRMTEPQDICAAAVDILNKDCSLAGKKVVVTAGPTRERLDPVRYLSNFSSGKMGYALAAAAFKRGAEVVLISGPVALPEPIGVTTIKVESALEMQEATTKAFEEADILIMAAAVADYRPARAEGQKLKKAAEAKLELALNPDILTALGAKKGRRIMVGFAAETNDLPTYAQAKLTRKNLDLIVANDVSQPGAGFEVDTNIVTIIDSKGQVRELPKLTKEQVAHEIIDSVVGLPEFAGLEGR